MTLPGHILFVKYHGAGNDFVCIDDRDGAFAPFERRSTIGRLCDRHYGIGADGLIVLRHLGPNNQDASETALLKMVYYNSDGASSSFCGNGSRCFLKFALDLGLLALPEAGSEPVCVPFEANDGLHDGFVVTHNSFRVSMRLAGGVERYSASEDTVDTGSPHFVRWCAALPGGDITAEAHSVRYGPAFAKTGTNVNFAEVLAGDTADTYRLAIRTYERGVEAETQACGTGVTAAALSFAERHQLTGRQHIEVRAVGGGLSVDFVRNERGDIDKLFLTGPAERVFAGRMDTSRLLEV